MRMFHLLSLFTGVCQFLAAPLYAASIHWSSPTELPSLSQSSAVELAAYGPEKVMVLWSDGETIKALAYNQVEGWQLSNAICLAQSAEGQLCDPKLVEGPNGRLLALWSHKGVLQGSIFNPSQGWSPVEPLSRDNSFAQQAEAVWDPSGYATLIWAAGGSIQIARFDSEQMKWSSPTLLSDEKSCEAERPSLASDPQGNIVAAWSAVFNGSRGVQCRRFDASQQGWGSIIELSALRSEEETSEKQGYYPRVACDSQGNAMVVWQAYQGTHPTLGAAYFDIQHHNWRLPSGSAFLTSTAHLYSPQVVFDLQGNAHVIWQSFANKEASIRHSCYDPVKELWRPSSEGSILSSRQGLSAEPLLVSDSLGELLAVWQHEGQVEASFYDPVSGWQPFATLSSTGQERSLRALIRDGKAWVSCQSAGHYQIIHYEEGRWRAPAPVANFQEQSCESPSALFMGSTPVAIWRNQEGVVCTSAFDLQQRAWSGAQELVYLPYESQIGLTQQGQLLATYLSAGEIKLLSIDRFDPTTALTTTLSLEPAQVDLPRLAVEPSGQAIVAWVAHQGDQYALHVSHRKANKSWQPPTVLVMGSEAIVQPCVAIDPLGNRVVVWQRGGKQSQRVEAAYFNASVGSWSEPRVVATASSGQSFDALRLSINSEGDVLAGWQIAKRLRTVVQAAICRQGNWEPPKNLSPDSYYAFAELGQVDLNSLGSAAVVWTLDNLVHGSVYQPAEGGWQTQPLSEINFLYNQNPHQPLVASDEQGNFLALWRIEGADVQASRYDERAGGWSATKTLSSLSHPGAATATPSLAMSAEGDALALWCLKMGPRESLQAAQFFQELPQPVIPPDLDHTPVIPSEEPPESLPSLAKPEWTVAQKSLEHFVDCSFFVTELRWRPVEGAVRYNLYRNYERIASIEASQEPCFFDPRRQEQVSDLYELEAIGPKNQRSERARVEV